MYTNEQYLEIKKENERLDGWLKAFMQGDNNHQRRMLREFFFEELEKHNQPINENQKAK